MFKMCGIGEEFIFMRKVFLMPENVLAIFIGLVGVNIETILFLSMQCMQINQITKSDL